MNQSKSLLSFSLNNIQKKGRCLKEIDKNRQTLIH